MTRTLPRIGELYDARRPELPEGASWRLSPAGVELLLSIDMPSAGSGRTVGSEGAGILSRIVGREVPADPAGSSHAR